MTPPTSPNQAGSRVGFLSEIFLTNSSSDQEALNCTLPPKTLHQEGITLIIIWFRVASLSVRLSPLATYSQMGRRPPSPDIPQAKRRWRNERSATLSAVAEGEGEGREYPTPSATTPVREATKAWMVASEIPRATRIGAGGGTIG